jgi:hypothetical protein
MGRLKDSMVGEGGTDHERHRALSVSVGPTVAVNREPREPGRQRAARGRMGRAPGGRGVGVSPLHHDAAAVQSRRGADVAASRQLPVPDPPARTGPSCEMWRAWRGADPGAVGRATVAVHAVVRAPRHRRIAPTDVSGATRILRISWDEAWGVLQRAVTRGRARKQARIVRRIGVDEKAAAKGHRYLTLVCDLDEGTVEHIAEDRTQKSLDGYYAGLTQAQRDGIEAVAMDMWEPYVQAIRAGVPEAAEKIVFDRFHVMGHIGKAVDTVRKQEHRALMASGDETLKAASTCGSTARRTCRSDGARSSPH